MKSKITLNAGMQCECVLLSFLLIIQFENCSLTILDYRIKLVIFKSLWVPFQKTFSTSFLELSSLDILKSKLRDTQDNYLFKRIFCTYNKNCICYHQNSFVKPWSQQRLLCFLYPWREMVCLGHWRWTPWIETLACSCHRWRCVGSRYKVNWFGLIILSWKIDSL